MTVKRYYVVKHTWTVVHELDVDSAEEDDMALWHLTENHCAQNTARDLARVADDASARNTCVLCAVHQGESLGAYASQEAVAARFGELPVLK
jgi:hypothetical protein